MINLRNALAVASFCFLTASFSTAQNLPTDPETNKVILQETVDIDTVGKAELYERAKEWMTVLFKSSKFDVNDKVNYKLVNEGNFPVSFKYDFKYTSNNTVTYNLTIDLKEGKYRYTLSDFKVYDTNIGPKAAQTLEAYFQKMKTASKGEFVTNFNNETTKIVADMKQFMATGKGEEKDDW